MINSRDHLPLAEEFRLAHLDAVTESLFGDLSPEEMDALADQYQETDTFMFEVERVDPDGSAVLDLYEGFEIGPVHFPPQLISLLRKQDIFMGTLGLKDSEWTVLYLSPCYTQEEIMVPLH